MVEKILVSPARLRCYGNVIDEHSLDDFIVSSSGLAKEKETVNGALISVYKLVYSVYGLMFDFDKGNKQLYLQMGEADILSFGFDTANKQLYLVDENDTGFRFGFDEDTNELYVTDEAPPIISISASSPYLLSGETTDLVVTLQNAFGSPIIGKTVTLSDGTSSYSGITNTNGLFTLSDVEVSSGYKTFTATYGTVSDSVDVFLCTSVDYATSNKNTNMWTLSNFTLSRGDSYSTLTEGSSTGTCLSDSSHKIAPTQTISFDLCQMDGTKYYSPIYIRNDGGGTSLANISYSELNANVGDWVHMKIVFNNTSTITIYADTLDEPITKTLSATSTNYRLMFYGNNTITTLYFKNVAIY